MHFARQQRLDGDAANIGELNFDAVFVEEALIFRDPERQHSAADRTVGDAHRGRAGMVFRRQAQDHRATARADRQCIAEDVTLEKRSLSRGAVDGEPGILHDISHVDGVGHDAPHVVFHELGIDAVFLKLFRVGIFFQNLFSDEPVFYIDAGVELIKFQSVIVHPWILFAEHIEIARHGAGRIVAFGYGDAEQPGSFECGVGKAIHGELDAEQRLGVDHVFAAETERAAELEPVLGMRFARLADQVFTLFFDGFGQPHPAHFGMGAIIKDGVFFRRDVFDEVIPFLGPALELFPAALASAKQSLPGMGRPLVITLLTSENVWMNSSGSNFVRV